MSKMLEQANTECDLKLNSSSPFDTPSHFDYACGRPGRPGAAEPAKPRQGREAATVRKCLWVPPVTCPDIYASVLRHLHLPDTGPSGIGLKARVAHTPWHRAQVRFALNCSSNSKIGSAGESQCSPGERSDTCICSNGTSAGERRQRTIFQFRIQ